MPRTAPGQRKKPNANVHAVSFTTCVKTLSGITISRRGLLHLEMAVGLAVFLDAGVADKSAKSMLQEIYAGAGYQCADSSGSDYKTVNRHIQAASALFGKLGIEVLNHWCDSKRENKMIQAIAHELTSLGFNSLDDVFDYSGKTSNRTAPKARAEKVWDIEVGEGVKVHLPSKLTEAQLVELASKILALAEALHDAAGTPEDVPAAGQEGPGEGVVDNEDVEAEVVGERRHGPILPPVDLERRVH